MCDGLLGTNIFMVQMVLGLRQTYNEKGESMLLG